MCRRLVHTENEKARCLGCTPPVPLLGGHTTHTHHLGLDIHAGWGGGVCVVCVCGVESKRTREWRGAPVFLSSHPSHSPLASPRDDASLNHASRRHTHLPHSHSPMRLFACCARPAAASDDGDAARHAPLRAGATVSPSPAWAAPDVVPRPNATRGPGKAAVEPRPPARATTTRRVIRGARVALGPQYALPSAAGPVAPPSSRGSRWSDPVEAEGPPSPDRRAARAAALAAGARARSHATAMRLRLAPLSPSRPPPSSQPAQPPLPAPPPWPWMTRWRWRAVAARAPRLRTARCVSCLPRRGSRCGPTCLTRAHAMQLPGWLLC